MSIARLQEEFQSRSGRIETRNGERILRWQDGDVSHRANLGTSSNPSRKVLQLGARGVMVPGVGDVDPFGRASFHGKSEYAPLVGGGKLRTRTMGPAGWVRPRAYDQWWGDRNPDTVVLLPVTLGSDGGGRESGEEATDGIRFRNRWYQAWTALWPA